MTLLVSAAEHGQGVVVLAGGFGEARVPGVLDATLWRRSNTIDSIPSCSAVILASRSPRRPATMTLLPSTWNRQARPMPDVPPVIKTVLSDVSMVDLLSY
jgi:hypothetical protein